MSATEGKPAADTPPDDIELLKALVARLRAENAQLKHNVEVYRRLAFGPSTERRPLPSTAQDQGREMQAHLFEAELFEEALRTSELTGSEGSLQQQSAGEQRLPKKGGRRKTFPPQAPVYRTTYELPESDRVCACGARLHEIGEDLRRELERVEMTIVHEIACKKYGCRSCENGVRTAAGPVRVIEKGILGKGFLAQVLIDRFQNHMPYYRLGKKYASEGLELSRSVLQRSMSRLAELFEPIWKELGREVLASSVIHTDDTPVTVARDGHGGTKQGRAWIYLDLENRHFYDFTDSRKRDGPMAVLEDYEGYIHADAYPGYDQVYLPGAVIEVGCWAHVRRKFVTAEASDPTLAKEAIDRIRRLYAIEKDVKDLGGEERVKVRKERAVPLLVEIRAWLDLTETRVLPKSPMAQAIRYALNQWDALVRYVEDGRLAIDNNAAERALRPFAVGRKNWLFFQNDTGGKTAVVLASLLQTAKAIGLDARSYFRDLMTRISTCSDVKKLTPHGWREHFAGEVEERQQRAMRIITAQI